MEAKDKTASPDAVQCRDKLLRRFDTLRRHFDGRRACASAPALPCKNRKPLPVLHSMKLALDRLGRIARTMGPYLLIELVLPGGTLVAFLLWLTQRHMVVRGVGALSLKARHGCHARQRAL